MCDKTAGDDTNLQHFATLFSTMQYFITIYNISPHSAAFRIILQHFVTFATILNIFARCYISQNFASFRQDKNCLKRLLFLLRKYLFRF